MSFSERISYASFIDNQEMIESEWDSIFGDRKIELVFIGQNIDVTLITQQLDDCLLTESELAIWQKGQFPIKDHWPIPNYQES